MKINNADDIQQFLKDKIKVMRGIKLELQYYEKKNKEIIEEIEYLMEKNNIDEIGNVHYKEVDMIRNDLTLLNVLNNEFIDSFKEFISISIDFDKTAENLLKIGFSNAYTKAYIKKLKERFSYKEKRMVDYNDKKK